MQVIRFGVGDKVLVAGLSRDGKGVIEIRELPRAVPIGSNPEHSGVPDYLHVVKSQLVFSSIDSAMVMRDKLDVMVQMMKDLRIENDGI